MSVSLLARRLRAVLALTVALLLGLLMVAPVATAHDVLTESNPADGDALEEAPAEIVLTFNNDPLDMGNALTLADDSGATVAEVEGAANGRDVVFDLSGTEIPAGELTANWRVVSSDGHPIEGTLTFSVAEAAVEPTEPDTEAPETAAPDATTQETVTEEATPIMAEDAQDTDEATTDLGGLPTWAKILIALAALAAVIALIVGVVQRMRRDE